MIKARMDSSDGKKIYLLGLSDENLKRLQEEMPIAIRCDELGLGPAGNPDQIVIMWGPTEEKILDDLRAFGIRVDG